MVEPVVFHVPIIHGLHLWHPCFEFVFVVAETVPPGRVVSLQFVLELLCISQTPVVLPPVVVKQHVCMSADQEQGLETCLCILLSLLQTYGLVLVGQVLAHVNSSFEFTVVIGQLRGELLVEFLNGRIEKSWCKLANLALHFNFNRFNRFNRFNGPRL